MCLNIIKAIDDKLTANIILNSEMLKPFPTKSGTKVPSYQFNTTYSGAIKQEKEINNFQIRKEQL